MAEHTVVTFEAFITDRSRALDGTYYVGRSPIIISLLANDDDDDISLSMAAFDLVHTTVAEPVDGMILSFRLIHSVE